LEIGQSTVREVRSALGDPAQEKETPDGAASRYPSLWERFPQTVISDEEDGVIRFVAVENVSLNYFNLRVLQAEFGQSVRAAAPAGFGDGLQLLFFPGKGTAAIIDRVPPAQILYLQRFSKETTLEEYQDRKGYLPEMFGYGMPFEPKSPAGANTSLAPEVPLPADPQRVEFKSGDGTLLVGTYYPAKSGPAPVIVLFHWLGGGKEDWQDRGLVEWLRHRGLPNPGAPAGLYPEMPEGLSFAVFAFDYRGHGESGWINDDPQGWLLDGLAAIEAARSLPGVDPRRAIAIGASIGADGAVDACGEGCLGALSLSPDGYLNVAYHHAVAALDFEGKPAWCIASVLDKGCPPRASGGHYRAVVYPGRFHGMQLLDPGLSPNVGRVILDFILECLNHGLH
jgi:dienelactone hydrolase